VETVLIYWSVDPEREEEFFAYRKPVDHTAAGFDHETLYRIDAVDGAADQRVNFVNLAQWNSRDEFYAYFKTAPGAVPDLQPFEVAPRRREWLVSANP
jgi:heme-degrading monooxygenase HmoA